MMMSVFNFFNLQNNNKIVYVTNSLFQVEGYGLNFNFQLFCHDKLCLILFLLCYIYTCLFITIHFLD